MDLAAGGDADYSTRWRNIKRAVTQQVEPENRPAVSARRWRKKEQAIWQPKFWEHRIRDERDHARHIDYVHFNRNRLPTIPSGKRDSSFLYRLSRNPRRQGIAPWVLGRKAGYCSFSGSLIFFFPKNGKSFVTFKLLE